MELTIEKLIYGGDGLARLPADEKGRGKAAFVPFTLAGERVEISVREVKPGFVRGVVSRMVEASPERVLPDCPYFQRCGGCHYQHTGYAQQLEIKAGVLRENLRRLARLEFLPELTVHPSQPWKYRNRTRLQLRASGEFVLGYFKAGSHEVLSVETCPISSPLINRAMERLWRWGRAGKIAAELREVELFANADDAQLRLEFYADPRSDKSKWTSAAQDLTERLQGEMPEVVGAVAFAPAISAKRGRVGDSGEEPAWTSGSKAFLYRSKAQPLRVSAGSFFQVNRFLIDELVETVAAGRTGEFALDLYAGVGLFSAALAPSFHHIMAVESSHGSVKDLQYNSPENVKATRSTVEEFLTAKAGKMRPELVVADPPRAGLGERVARALDKLGAPRLIYISCDPATLARDLGTLIESGYRVERMHLMDLFPQTYHIESVVELVR